MSYLPHTAEDRRFMLERLGLSSVDELYRPLPQAVRLARELDLPPALAEPDLLEHLRELASRNTVPGGTCFLGAGAYRHYVPAVVDAVISRSEFFTAYTPYQAEASQGTLQAIFEFQSLICRLTALDVANASVYDGATAAVEAALMALRHTRRRRLLISRGVHPHIRQVLSSYLAPRSQDLEEVPLEGGRTRLPPLTGDVAAVLFQVPNFLGVIEDAPDLCRVIARAGAVPVAVVGDPVSLAVLRPPGDYGAHIAVGEAQPLGLPPSFGGPYVGMMAARRHLMRQLPGRLVGLTRDAEGRRGFCLTLQAREQHIRREKASSNICTNQGLCALAVTVYLALLGPRGLREVALASMDRAAYAREKLGSLPGFSVAFPAPVFHEFALRCPVPPRELNRRLLERGILGGYPLGDDYPELEDSLLLCFTEVNGRADVDRLADALAGIAGSRAAVGGGRR